MVIIPDRFAAAKPSPDRLPWRLTEEIVALSVSDAWLEAKYEWQLSYVFFADPDCLGVCLCGKKNIREQCVLENVHNGNTAIVGNHCVRRFMVLPSDAIFRCLRKVINDDTAALNVATVEYAYDRGWINDRERGFCLDTVHRPARPTICSPGLSEKQLAWRKAINSKVVAQMAAGQEAAHA